MNLHQANEEPIKAQLLIALSDLSYSLLHFRRVEDTHAAR